VPHASVRVAPQLVLQPAWYKSCMVDFKKRLSGPKNGAKPLIPAEIYDKADRESDTRPLRPAQISVLDEWQNQRRATRDVNIKMHTGPRNVFSKSYGIRLHPRATISGRVPTGIRPSGGAGS